MNQPRARILVPKQSASKFFLGLFCGSLLTVAGLGAAKAYEDSQHEDFIYTYRLSRWYNNPYSGQQIIQHDYVWADRVEVVDGNCFRLWIGHHPTAAECGDVRIVRTADHFKPGEDEVNPPTRVKYRTQSQAELEYLASAE